MKTMHGWLPIMHNLGKYKDTKQCPGCPCPDETFLHLFQCDNERIWKGALEKSLDTIRDRGIKGSASTAFMDHFINCIRKGIRGKAATPPMQPNELRQAIVDQNSISTSKMLQGYIAQSWTAALREATGCKHPNTCIRALHRLLWSTLFKQVGDTRNFILYHTPNHYNREENSSLAAKLHWYRENRHTALAEGDRHLADHDTDAIEQMGRKTEQKWIQ